MRVGFTDEQIFDACSVDPWFLAEIRGIVDTEAQITAKGLPTSAGALRQLKAMGFSDTRLAKLTGMTTADVAAKRRALGVRRRQRSFPLDVSPWLKVTLHLAASSLLGW